MKIMKDGLTLTVSARGPGLKLKDVEPGDVFRFANGAAFNIYIMGQEGNYFFLNGAAQFDGRGSSSQTRVIVYPNAEMDLGDECFTPESLKAALNGIEVSPITGPAPEGSRVTLPLSTKSELITRVPADFTTVEEED